MKRRNFFLFVFFWVCVIVRSQECPLGLGGTDPQQIAKVFEFDTAQEQRMLKWVDSLEQKNAPLQLELDELLASHPQQTPEQLTAMGQKYEEIKEKMVRNSRFYDRLLLGIFRPVQYRKYEELCAELDLYPLEPTSEALLKGQENE
ncbi:MAG: hypothetical protein WBN13_05250 [Robiginitalea sp.]|uniref:hypothetical protein n=1 Tax=Robiginitalea sp. TaxID=1902411 RepID=UPI003C766898